MTSRRGPAGSSPSCTRWRSGCPPARPWCTRRPGRAPPGSARSRRSPCPAVRDRAVAALAEHGCDRVLFGAAAPLGLLAPALRQAGAERIVAVTHGHEAGWAALPGARALLRRIGDSVDVVTYLGEYTRVRLARALSPPAGARGGRLPPPGRS